MGWGGGDGQITAYRVLAQKPDAKRSLNRSRCRWEDNPMMDPTEIAA